MTTDNRTLAEIKQDHQYETSYAIKNANAMYFKSQDAAYKFWGMCHFKAITALGIKPEDMERAVATDDGVVNSAFTLDNVRVEVERIPETTWPSLSYRTLRGLGLATDIEVFPNLDEEELPLCRKLLDIGTVPMNIGKRVLTLDESVTSEGIGNDKLRLFRTDRDTLEMVAVTSYHPVGRQSFRVSDMKFATYMKELATARRYGEFLRYTKWLPRFINDPIAHLLAGALYPHFGLGHGFNDGNFFRPAMTEREWTEREGKLPSEVARHTIVDKLGALSLLGGRLTGMRVDIRYSNHVNDIKVLKEQVSRYIREVRPVMAAHARAV